MSNSVLRAAWSTLNNTLYDNGFRKIDLAPPIIGALLGVAGALGVSSQYSSEINVRQSFEENTALDINNNRLAFLALTHTTHANLSNNTEIENTPTRTKHIEAISEKHHKALGLITILSVMGAGLGLCISGTNIAGRSTSSEENAAKPKPN